MYEDASDAKKITDKAISSASPNLFNGHKLEYFLIKILSCFF